MNPTPDQPQIPLAKDDSIGEDAAAKADQTFATYQLPKPSQEPTQAVSNPPEPVPLPTSVTPVSPLSAPTESDDSVRAAAADYIETTSPPPPPEPIEPIQPVPPTIYEAPPVGSPMDAVDTPMPLPLPDSSSEARRGLSHFLVEKYQREKSQWRPWVKLTLKILAVVLVVYGVFNSQLIMGQFEYFVSAGVSDTALPTEVPGDAAIVIPKINLTAPILNDKSALNEDSLQSNLERGVVHPGFTAGPGQNGNGVIFGHSSGNWWSRGNYKFAFVQLGKLDIGDTFYVDFKSARYTYEVFAKRIVTSQDTSVLDQTTDFPIFSLITCTPPGTSLKRLVVEGKQIDPDPLLNHPALEGNIPSGQLPSDGSSLWEKLGELFYRQ